MPAASYDSSLFGRIQPHESLIIHGISACWGQGNLSEVLNPDPTHNDDHHDTLNTLHSSSQDHSGGKLETRPSSLPPSSSSMNSYTAVSGL